jgi:PST family polysaccharide transporter
MLWTGLSRTGVQILQLVTFVIVARWLSPTEYGTFAIVGLVVTLVTLFNDFGLQAALVHDAEPSAARLASAFWLNATVGVVFSAFIALAACLVQALLDYPDLGLALAVAGLSFALSLTVVPSALLQRRLQLGLLAGIEFTASLAGAIAAICLAWRGFGVLSLSIGPVVTALFLTVVLTVTTGYIPTSRPTAADARVLWSFSGSLLAVNGTYYVSRNIDTIVLTVVSTPQQLGIYSRAYSLASAPVTQAGAVIGRVLFPILARCRDDPAVFKDRWLRTTFASFGILLPFAIAFAVTSPYVIGILFESRWHPIAPIVSILAIAVPTRLLCNALGPVYQATGHTQALFRVTLIQGAALTVGVLAGAWWGPIGVAWGVAVATNLASYIPLSVGLRYMDMSISELAIEFRTIFVAGTVQLLAMASIPLVGGLGTDMASLLACLVLGMTGYTATGWIFDRRYFGRLAGRVG